MKAQKNASNQPIPDPQSNTVPSKSGFRPLDIRNLMPGIVIGILIGIAGFLAYQRYFPQVTQTFYVVTLTTFGVVITGFLLVYTFKKRITAFIFGNATANAGEVIEDAQRVADALTDRFADTLLRDVAPDVRQRVRYILPRLTNWFVWSRFRNWWWRWVLGVFVSLGGLTGTLLLMNQNELLQNQNTLIQRQMSLEEANRRSALVVLMSNIMDKVDSEIKEQRGQLLKKNLSKAAVDSVKFSLSQSLIGQIAALSHSFKPYRYMEGDSLIDKPLSPERGQLLITLVQIPLDSNTLHQIYLYATFRNADLKDAILNRVNLSGLDLDGANFAKAYLIGADLHRTMLKGADLSYANLSNAILEAANMDGGVLKGTILFNANLRASSLVKADLLEAGLEQSNLRQSTLYGASLIRTNLGGADLSEADLLGDGFYGIANADLSEANLSGANLEASKVSISQLSQSYSLSYCKGLPDSIRNVLVKEYPHLFDPQ